MMDIQKLLIIEDNEKLRQYILSCVEKEGYLAVTASSGKSAFTQLREETFDLVLLDLKLGDINGMEILKTIRRQNESLPVIIVSTCMELNTKVDGFDIGCDDYITKPFFPEELISRIKRQLKRHANAKVKPQTPIKEVLKFGPYKLNVRSCSVFKNGQAIEMRKKLFDILLFFIRNPNQVINKHMLLSNCWEDYGNVSDNTLYVHIRQLRALIEENPEKPEYIQTVRGVGFIFNPEDKAKSVG